jgi:dodecin
MDDTHEQRAPGRGRRREALAMSVYKKVEIVGSSKTSFAEAARSAVAEASKSLRHTSWFEVVEQRGSVKDGKINEFQVTVRVGFKVE